MNIQDILLLGNVFQQFVQQRFTFFPRLTVKVMGVGCHLEVLPSRTFMRHDQSMSGHWIVQRLHALEHFGRSKLPIVKQGVVRYQRFNFLLNIPPEDLRMLSLNPLTLCFPPYRWGEVQRRE